MTRVKKAPLRRPGLGPAARRHARGRPPVDWTESRKRKLLRLYLGTPTSVLSLKDIRSILSEGNFRPAERKTQEVLQGLLSKCYNKRRPTSLTAMTKRLSFFRAIKRGWRESSDVEPTKLELTPVPHSRKQLNASPAQEVPIMLDNSAMALDQYFLPDFHPNGYGDIAEMPDTSPTAKQASPETLAEEFARNLLPPDAEPFEHAEVGQGTLRREARMSFLRDRLSGSRSSSVLSRVASLLSSNLSLRSSNSKSRRRGSKMSHSSSQSSSNQRPSPRVSQMASSASARSGTTSSKRGDATVLNISDEDLAVLEACCWKRQPDDRPCVHRLLKNAIKNSPYRPLGMHWVDAPQIGRDRLGNTLLHVAARWGAPWAILHPIILQGADPSATNQLRETFLHLYGPRMDPDVSANPETISHLFTTLGHRQFNFCIRDALGRTFLQRWTLHESTTLKTVEAGLAALPPFALQNILGDRTANGRQLLQWLRDRLGEAGLATDVAAYARLVADDYAVAQARLQLQLRAGGDVFYQLPPPRMGWNLVHRVIGGAALGAAQPARRAAYLGLLDSALETAASSALLVGAGGPRGVDNRERFSRRTPLMTLLSGWGAATATATAASADGAGDFLRAVLARLLDAGASASARDIRGYGALHYAVEAQLADVVLLLCRSAASVAETDKADVVNAEGLDGVTPLELARVCIQREIERTGSRDQDVAGLARLLECGTILIDYGGKRGSKGQDWKSWFDWGKYMMGEQDDLEES